jgi:hypothetical protein
MLIVASLNAVCIFVKFCLLCFRSSHKI